MRVGRIGWTPALCAGKSVFGRRVLASAEAAPYSLKFNSTTSEFASGRRDARRATCSDAPGGTDRQAVRSSMVTKNRQQAVLSFWRACEMFSPPQIPKVNAKDPSPVEQWATPRLLPWNPDHRPTFARTQKTSPARGRRPAEKIGYEWRHIVYLTVYPLDALYRSLQDAFPFDQESFDPRPGGQSALATFVVDQDGFMVADSAVLSACGWATGSVRSNPGRVEQLDGLDDAQQEWLARVDTVIAEHAGDPTNPKPLNADAMQALTDMTRSFTHFPSLSSHDDGARVQSRNVRSDRAGDVQADFLNSFFLDDLAALTKAAGEGASALGRAVSSYLTEHSDVPQDQRVDVQHDLSQVFAKVAPEHLPDGRWPSDPTHPLALSQQLAVDLVTQGEGDGLFSVNGPPGTGKTTMLRDVFASRVVERASKLAELKSPELGFSEALPQWQADGLPRRVHPLIGSLTGYEMVVASSNNAAVANVSGEIPAAAAIADCYRGSVDYFSDIATALLQPDQKPETRNGARSAPSASAPSGESDGSDDDTLDGGALADNAFADNAFADKLGEADNARKGWALAAARLGNKAYRSTFMTRFWIGDSTLDVAYESMQKLLARQKNEPTDNADWAAEVATFTAVVAAEKAAVKIRQEAFQALDQLAISHDFLTESASDWQQAAETAKSTSDELNRLSSALPAAQASLQALQDLEASRRGPRPGAVRNMLTFGNAGRRWEQNRLEPAEEDQRKVITNGVDELRQAHYRAELSHQQATQRINDLQAAISHHRAVVEQFTRVLDEAPASWGDALPSPGWWRRDVERREKTGPWLDQQINDLRVQVLLAALGLHAAFVRGNAQTFETTLRAAMDVVTGVAPVEVPAATRLAAWQVLFMVVPLVSTTFASFARMFRGLPTERLGWLLIDEAGQAAPQVAAGAMWRSKNVVVVGDPRQLQPVVTITPRLEGALAKAYGVDAKWRPLTTSVQAVADDVNRWGTWLADTPVEPRLWIGAPLRVHRRCDQPMLAICNEIAYPVSTPPDSPDSPDSPDDPDRSGSPGSSGAQSAAKGRAGLMIDGVAPREPLPIPRTQWYDQHGTSTLGHFVPAELELLRTLLDRVLVAGIPLRQVICVSPFKDTADRLKALADEYGEEFRGGTIHTAQGQEADVVFLVLGGDPKKPGAKAWASNRPNLVNVAVSRARRNLYVIGDEAAWSEYPYFNVLSARLREWNARDDTTYNKTDLTVLG